MTEEQRTALLELGISDEPSKYLEHAKSELEYIGWIIEAYNSISDEEDRHYSDYVKRCHKLSKEPMPRRSGTLSWVSLYEEQYTDDEIRQIVSIITGKDKSNFPKWETSAKKAEEQYKKRHGKQLSIFQSNT